MKKLIFLFTIIGSLCIISRTSDAQSPEWSWATSAGGTDYDFGFSLALDASGNAYVTGYFYSPTITFGSYTLTNVGVTDAFLVKYDANGNVLWATSAGGTDDDCGRFLALDASGNVYVIGYFFSSTITFGSYTLTNVGLSDVFLVKYDANGNVLWATSAGGTDTDESCSLALDASGNAYVTGNFSSPTITFGATTLTNSGSYDIFLVKYNANGNVLWATSAKGITGDWSSSLALDASGNAYVTGCSFSPTITFGSYTLTIVNDHKNDMFLAKMKSGNTGINEVYNTVNISGYPNPTSNTITIGTPSTGIITIHNPSGQQLLQQKITESTTTLDVTALPSGLYLVKVVGDKGVSMGKFIKQ